MACKEQFENVNDGLLVRAPAKINLSLLIAGKRRDGFHDIETVMAKINWYDQIFIEKGTKTGIDLVCKGSYSVPAGEENLVFKTCKLLLDTCDLKANIKITLTKNIPAGSGLGSASSDAAATLMGVNRFLGLGQSQQKLSQLAAKLGSDVAFFLGGPLAFCTGKGEKIEEINKKFVFLAILVIPDISVSTKTVYDNYMHDDDVYRRLNTQINAPLEKNRIDLVTGMCANMLQTTCFRLHSELAELKKRIEYLGIGSLSLSGSGSVMYFVVDDCNEQKAEEYQCVLREKIGCKSIIASSNRW